MHKLLLGMKNIFKIIFLGFLSLLYGIVIRFRNFFFDTKIFKSKEYGIPIISIGNISVGGTGKTPHTEYIASILRKNDILIAILSRGYKRKTHGFRIVNEDDSYFLTGDEPLQMKQKFPDVIVAVCEKRTVGVEKLLKLYPNLSAIILDDAFQHRQITPGFSIVLNNYNSQITDDYLLPLGRLREPANSINRANIIFYTKCPQNIKPIDIRILTNNINPSPYQYLYFSTIVYNDLKNVFYENDKIKNDDIKNKNVLAVTGIANSKNLLEYISKISKSVKHIKFSDHYDYRKKDFTNINKHFSQIEDDKIIIVTEKDGVKFKNNKIFPEELKNYVYCIPIEVKIIPKEEDKEQFEKQIENYVRNNKTYSRIYKGANQR